MSELGLGCMGMSQSLRRRRPRRVDRDDPPRARPRRARSSTPPTCTARTPTRSSSVRRSRAAATRSCSRRSSASGATPTTRPSHDQRSSRLRAQRVRSVAPPPRRRLTSTSTTNTASIAPCRSKTPSARWPSSSPRARCGTSACPSPAPTRVRRAHATHPISALQNEWSLWERSLETGVLPVARELGHRHRAVQPARPWLPHRPAEVAGRLRGRRLPSRPPPLPGRELRQEPRARREGEGPGRRRAA